MPDLRSKRVLAALLLALAGAPGCGDADKAPPGSGEAGVRTDGGGGGGPDLLTDDAAFPGMSTLRVGIPQAFMGTATKLYAVTSASYPPTMSTPLLSVDNPRVTAGQPYLTPFDGGKLKGNLYVLVFLFVQGGGGANNQPKPGLDYAGNTQSPFTFDGAQHDVGPIVLQLYK